jgi:hypothetical protein
MALPRDCYRHIFGPCREIPKFANRPHGHINVWSYFDLHLIRQTANGNVERGNALWPVTHKDLPRCRLQALHKTALRAYQRRDRNAAGQQSGE